MRQIVRVLLRHLVQKLLEVEAKYFPTLDSQSRRMVIATGKLIEVVSTTANDDDDVVWELKLDAIESGYGDAPCCNELGG